MLAHDHLTQLREWSSNSQRGANSSNANYPPPDSVDSLLGCPPNHIPNIRQYLRFGGILQFETCASGVRTQPWWLSPLASLNPSNSRGSLATTPRLLTFRLKKGGCSGFFRTAELMPNCASVPNPDAEYECFATRRPRRDAERRLVLPAGKIPSRTPVPVGH